MNGTPAVHIPDWINNGIKDSTQKITDHPPSLSCDNMEPAKGSVSTLELPRSQSSPSHHDWPKAQCKPDHHGFTIEVDRAKNCTYHLNVHLLPAGDSGHPALGPISRATGIRPLGSALCLMRSIHKGGSKISTYIAFRSRLILTIRHLGSLLPN